MRTNLFERLSIAGLRSKRLVIPVDQMGPNCPRASLDIDCRRYLMSASRRFVTISQRLPMLLFVLGAYATEAQAEEPSPSSDQPYDWSGFYAGGQVTYVTPSSGAATSFDLYVRGLLPTDTGLTLGQIAQVNLTGNEKYYIYWMHNPFTQFLFNSSSLVAGQNVSVGGPASGASNPDAVTVERIHLRNWGYNGTIVPGSESASTASFQMQVTGFVGQLIPETITVYLGDHTDFRYGLTAFSDLTDGAKIRVVGLLLQNPTNGDVVLLARHIDGVDLTNFTTTDFQ